MKATKGQTHLLWGLLPVILIIIGIWVFLTRQGFLTVKVEPPVGETQQTTGQSQTAPTPTPTPTRLKQGKETYIYSWGAGTTIPKLISLELDPHDPKVGETQKLKARMTHTSALASVSIKLYSDNKETTYPLTLVEGTDIDGFWSGSWKIDDTLLYRYVFTVISKTGGTEKTVDVALRGRKP